MTFYDDMAATALSLLAEFGTPIVLQRDSGETFDPVTDVVTPGSTANLTVSGVFSKTTQSVKDSFGGNVQSGDRVLIIDATQTPQTSDRVVVGGYPWKIVEIQPVSPAGIALIYRVLVRQ